jgi:hypothetical protein
MVKRALAIAFCVLLLCNIASAKIIGIFPTDQIGLKPVSLEEAKVTENTSSVNTSSNTSQPAIKTESIPGQSVVSGWVSAGLND